MRRRRFRWPPVGWRTQPRRHGDVVADGVRAGITIASNGSLRRHL